MKIPYNEYLKQVADGTWTGKITMEVEMLHDQQVAGFVDALTFYKESHEDKMDRYLNFYYPIIVACRKNLLGLDSGGMVLMDDDLRDAILAALKAL